MIELVGQRSQRPGLGAADLDLANQVSGQLSRHVADRYARQAPSWLPRIVHNPQLPGDPGLQRLQQCGLSRRQRDWLAAAERLVDLLGGLLRLHWVGEADLGHGGLHGSRDRRLQRACLVAAAHQRGQLLITGVGQSADQPPQQVINNKHPAVPPRRKHRTRARRTRRSIAPKNHPATTFGRAAHPTASRPRLVPCPARSFGTSHPTRSPRQQCSLTRPGVRAPVEVNQRRPVYSMQPAPRRSVVSQRCRCRYVPL
jgi:hypothetical protein